MAGTIAREQVDDIAMRQAEPNWLLDSRVAAWEAYLHTPMPTGREEIWRGVDVGSIELAELKTKDIEPAGKFSAQTRVPAWLARTLASLNKRSGLLIQSLVSGSALELAPELQEKGVVFCDVATAVAKHAELLRPYLEQLSTTEIDSKFSLLTQSLFNCGFVLFVPANVVLEDPFVFALDATGANSECAVALLPRVLVVAAPHSKATVIYGIGSDGDSKMAAGANASLVSQYIEMEVGPGSSLDYLEVQALDPSISLISRFKCNVERDARLKSLSLGLGGKQTKADLYIDLRAPGAFSEILGTVFGAGQEQYSFNTIQDHSAADTKSDINFRVALKGASASTYQGWVRVAKVAQRTDAYQSNKNLLLDGRAKADTIPRLEILADDVKCAHGATVGPVDREQLFYLMSRGLTRMQAEQFVVEGFFKEILEKFPLPQAVDWVSDLVSEKVHRPDEEAAGAEHRGHGTTPVK